MNLFIDIETIPGPHRLSLEEVIARAPGNMSKADTIKKWAEANVEKVYRDQATDSMQGRVLAIGYAYDDDDPACFIGHDEEQVLRQFEAVVRSESPQGYFPGMWVGHNVKEFDLQWLWRKACFYGLKDLKLYMPRERWPSNVLDTQEIWAGPSYREKCSLTAIASFFHIPSKSLMDGSQVYDFYVKGDLDKIAEYCCEDISTTRAIFERIT